MTNEQKAKLKKILNRGGLIVAAVGVIVVIATGGDAGATIDILDRVATFGGLAMILLREFLN